MRTPACVALARRLRRTRDEHGSITLAVAIMAVAFLILGGLVVDGGRQLNARLRAQATAEEAARVGANLLDLNEDGLSAIDENRAGQAVANFCSAAQSADPTITDCSFGGVGNGGQYDSDYIEVTVTIEQPTTLLGLIGKPTVSATETHRAYPRVGITDPDNDVLNQVPHPIVRYPTVTTDPPTNVPEPTSVPALPTYLTVGCQGEDVILATNEAISCSTTTSISETTTTSTTTSTIKEPPPPPETETITETASQTSTVTSTNTATIPTSMPPIYPSE